MSKWSDKVAESARERLAVPAGKLPCGFAEVFRRFLKVETQRVRMLHRGGGGGREVCAARTVVVDVLLQHALDAYLDALTSATTLGARGAHTARNSLTLVALGGYGRAELSPLSDVDLMLLHDRRPGDVGPLIKALMEKLVPFLWEVGLECHPLVRNQDDCVREAQKDMVSKTALLEARRVWGDARLFEQMRILIRDRCLEGNEDAYIEERLKDQEQRRAKWGQSFCLLEPNVKNGCGGIRDFQNLTWMARVKHGIQKVGELVELGKLVPADLKHLEHGYDFLLRVRNELHYQQERRSDILTRALQPAVALQLGYSERSLAKRVSRFMGDYYRHVRNVHLITRNLERRLALRPPGRLRRLGRLIRDATPFREKVVDGFRIVGGELKANAPRIFKEQPRRLMRAFLIAQQRGLQFHPDLEDQIRQNLSLVNRAFLADAHVHETFLEILNQRGNVAHIVRAMHETGFLGKYIPAFHELTCQVQHEFFHLYTADEHTLVCLEMLDRVWDAKAEPFGAYSDLFRSLDRPYVLYLALLLHDVGKADDTQDHAVESTRVALSVTRRLRLPSPAAATIAFLVRHHLLMVRLSQKLDLDDPEVIRDFATQVQTSEQLNLLTLHTFADSMGTSETLWTPFKESLLWALHRRTERMLAGEEAFRVAAELHRKNLRSEVKRGLPKTFHPDEIDAHFGNLPERYFVLHTAKEIAADIVLAHQFMWNQVGKDEQPLRPVVSWHAEPDRGYTVLKVCTWDRPRLFSRITGALAAVGLNILGARVFSRPDGPVFDTLFVNDPATGRPPGREAREKFEELLTASLCGQDVCLRPPPRGGAAAATAAPTAIEGVDRIPTRIRFDNDIVRGHTVVEVEAEDHVGLLFELTSALADLGLEIDFSRISTEKGAAVDVFHVRERGGQAVTGRERLDEVERRLRAVLEPARGVAGSAKE